MCSRTAVGIAWALANNVFAVVDRLLQRLMLASDQSPVDISKTGVTLLNNILGVVPLIFGAMLTSEFGELPAVVEGLDRTKLFWLASSCIVGAGISYTGVWVASLISATSFLVLINANKFFIVFLEFGFMNKHQDLTARQVVGAVISILAGIAYGKARDAVHAAEMNIEDDETSESSDDSSSDDKMEPLTK